MLSRQNSITNNETVSTAVTAAMDKLVTHIEYETSVLAGSPAGQLLKHGVEHSWFDVNPPKGIKQNPANLIRLLEEQLASNSALKSQIDAVITGLKKYGDFHFSQNTESAETKSVAVKREKSRDEAFLDIRSKLLVQNQRLEGIWEEAVFGSSAVALNKELRSEQSSSFRSFFNAFIETLGASTISADTVSGRDVCQYYCLYAHVQGDLQAAEKSNPVEGLETAEKANIVNARVNDYITYHAENNQLDKINPVVLYHLGQKAANPDQALASNVETDALLENTDEPVVVAEVNEIQPENVGASKATAYPVDNAVVVVAKQENAIDTIVKRLEKVNEYSGGVQVNLPKVIALLTIAAKAMNDGDNAQLKSALSAAGAVVKGRMSFWNQALSCRAMSFFSSNNAWAGVQRQQAYEALLPLVHINSHGAKDVNAALSNINNKLDTVLAKEEGMKMSKGIQCAVSVDSAQGQNKAASSEVPTVVDYLSMR